MLDSDSDLEIAEPTRPAAAVARSALLHPTSPSVADPSLEPRPSQPVASSSNVPYTAGTWAPKSRDKQPGSSSSSAPRPDSALNSNKRNSLGGTGGSSGGGAGKETSGGQKAQSGVDTKGKGRADVIVLSSDDDDDDDEPLVVHRRPPRASLPSSPTISSTAKPKPSFRRHSLAHSKPAPKTVHALSRPPENDSSDSSEPDPLAMRPSSLSSPSKFSPGKKKKKKDRTVAATDEAGKGGGGSKSSISARHRPRAARESTNPRSHRRPTPSSSPSSSSSESAAASSSTAAAFKQPRPPSSTADAAQQGGGRDKTKVSRPESAPIKRGPARKSTLGRPAATVLAPSETVPAATPTPTGAKESSSLPPQQPAASKPSKSSFPAETRDNAKVRPSSSSSSSSAAAAVASTEAAPTSQPRSLTSPKPSDAGLASSVSERGPPSSSSSAAAAAHYSAGAPPKPPSRLPASVANAPPPSARRPKMPPLVAAGASVQGSKASPEEKTPSSVDAGRGSSTLNAKKAEQPKRPLPTSTASSSSIGQKSSSGAETAARSTPPPLTTKLDTSTASKSPSGSRLPEAVRNRSPLRAASKGASPARSSSNVNMDMDVDARPESARTTEPVVAQKEGAPVSSSQTQMDDSDSDIEFITPIPKPAPAPAPVASHAAPVAPKEDGLARLDDSKTATAREAEAGKPSVESLTEAVTHTHLDDNKIEAAKKDAEEKDDGRAEDEKRAATALPDDRDGEDVEMADGDGNNQAEADLGAETGSDGPHHVSIAVSKTSSSPEGETAAAEGASATENTAGEATSKPSPAAPSAADAEPAAQPEKMQTDRAEDGKTAAAGLSPPTDGAVSGAQDVTMRDVPLVSRELARIDSPATSTSSPSHTPGPGDSSAPSRRVYGRGHKSTGGRPVKKGVNRVRAIESEESAADPTEASVRAFKTLAVAKQSVTSTVPPRLREDSDMAEAADSEKDGTSSASDSSGSSSFRLEQALLPNRPPSRTTGSVTRPDKPSPVSEPALASEVSHLIQDPRGRTQKTLDTTSEVERRDEFVGPRSRRPGESDLQGQDSSSSSATAKRPSLPYKHGGIGRKSSGPWDKRKSQHKTLDSVVPLGPSVAVSASDPLKQTDHPMELDEKTDSGSATERLPKSSVVDRPLKRERVAAADSAQLGSGWAVMMQKMHELPLLLMPADIDPDDPNVLDAQRDLIRKFKRKQKLEQPWARQIAGPSYDFLDEFRTDIQDTVNRREAKWAKLRPDELPIRDSYKVIFEQMVLEALATEYGPTDPASRPQIRVCPPTDLPPVAMSSPPFDFIYTNRVVYDDDIVPIQAPGCGCEGNCDTPANRKTCSCLARQIKACKTKGTDRSDHQDFAYDWSGKLKPAVFETLDEVIECNSQCGCGPECINRVVGKRQGISVDIFWTGIAGWGARLPTSYPSTPLRQAYSQRVIHKGEPLAVYAGELMRCKDAYEREDNVYSRIHRNYIFDLDAWTVLEDIESLLPSSQTKKLAEQAPPIDAQTASTHRSTGTKGRAKGKRQVEEKPFVKPDEPEDSGAKALFSIDAFSLGNWTRFCNHVCTDWNVSIRPVYVDEADVARPLFVYFARRDIQPGEEITITYFGGEEEPSPRAVGLTNAEWKRCADEARNNAPKSQRCYCGKKFCRGRMFSVPDQTMFWDVE